MNINGILTEPNLIRYLTQVNTHRPTQPRPGRPVLDFTYTPEKWKAELTWVVGYIPR